MSEVKNGFVIEQIDKTYILLIDLDGEHLLIKCINKLTKELFSSKRFTIVDIHKMNKSFTFADNIKQIQILLNVTIENGKIGLLEDDAQITIFFYLSLDNEENIVAFPLMKQKNILKKFKNKEIRNIYENNNYSKILEKTIKKLEDDNNDNNKKIVSLNEQINELKIENDELKKELKLLKEDNNILRKENEDFKEYKHMYELITQNESNDKIEFKGEMLVCHEIEETIYNKVIKFENKDEEKRILKIAKPNQKNSEEENNMNIIYNDYYESENEKEMNIVNKDNIENDIKVFEEGNKNINNNIIQEAQQIQNENNIKKENMENNEEEALKSQEDFNNELIKQIQKDNVGDNIETFIYKEKEENYDLRKEIDYNEDEINKRKEISIEENKRDNSPIEKEENRKKENEVFNIEANNKMDFSKVKVDSEYSEDEIEYIRNNEIIIHRNQDIEKNNNNINEIAHIEKNEEIISKGNKEEEIKYKNTKPFDNIESNKNIKDNKSNEEIQNKENSNSCKKMDDNEKNFIQNSIENIIINNYTKDNIENVSKEKDINIKTENNLEINNEMIENINLEAKKHIKGDHLNSYNININNNANTNEEEKIIIHQTEDLNQNTKKEENHQNGETKKVKINGEINGNNKNKFGTVNKEEQKYNTQNNKETEINEVSNKNEVTNNLLESNSKYESEKDAEEISVYYYNDQVNEDYKPSITPIKEKFNTNKKSISHFEEDSLSRNRYINIQNKKIKGNIIQSLSNIDFIANHIHKNKYKINLNLIYKASLDGDSSSIFHEKCDKAQTTLVQIETNDNKKFGGYTKRTWLGSHSKKNDNDAFIFSLNKKKIYKVIKDKNVIGCYNEFGPYFLGAFKIYDNSLIKGGILLNNEKYFEIDNIEELINDDNNRNNLNEQNIEIKFGIKEVEVYEVKIA